MHPGAGVLGPPGRRPRTGVMFLLNGAAFLQAAHAIIG